MSNDDAESKGQCKVCQGPAAGLYFGAMVCLPCKSFYIRCTKDGVKLRCQQDPSACTISKGRFKCQACRFKACLAAGMQRKEEKPEVISAPEGSSLCKVCGDIANGVHFGVTSCEGCKKFFRRGLTESQNYSCKDGGACPINPRTRNQCRYCRYQACLAAGMSREAIKVGRPPSKKENSRHHPYGHINLSMSHVDTSPKLYTNNHQNGNGYMKQELPWLPSDSHHLSSFPALIHGSHPMVNGRKINDVQPSTDLNSSCTSAEINEMLQNLVDTNGDMLSLPELDDDFAAIPTATEPSPSQKPTGRLQRIENLPHPPQQQSSGSYHQHAAMSLISAQQKMNFPLQPIKSESSTAYREPVNDYSSHPSPPYDTNLEAYGSPPSMYTNTYNTTQPQGSLTMVSKQAYNHASSQGYAQPAGSPNNYMSGAGGLSPQRRQAFEMSPTSANHQGFDPLSTHLGGVNDQAMFSSSGHARPSCEMGNGMTPGQHPLPGDHSNPYAQPDMSPYSLPSGASSPQSTSNGTSGYATDSHEYLDEYSIYDPMDIQQVNYKYMPSCSHQPLRYNEQALTVEDLWGKNEKVVKQPSSDTKQTDESSQEERASEGSGMFKRMKSIDDKISQDYWFEHKIPDVDFTPQLKAQLETLTTGWLRCKEYIGSNLKTASDDGGKESHWPNVKENAPLQLKMWEFIKHRLLRGTQAQVMFYQQIKGSEKVPEKDQKTLVSTASFSNCLLINILYWWDEDREQCKYFWSWKVPTSDPFYVFRQTLLKFSRAIRDLNFDEKEIMTLSALMLFSSDIIQIEKKDVIEKERKRLVNLCAAYMRDKYKDKYRERFREMLAMVPALRYLAIWHQDLMAFAKTFGSVGLSLDKMKISET